MFMHVLCVALFLYVQGGRSSEFKRNTNFGVLNCIGRYVGSFACLGLVHLLLR